MKTSKYKLFIQTHPQCNLPFFKSFDNFKVMGSQQNSRVPQEDLDCFNATYLKKKNYYSNVK